LLADIVFYLTRTQPTGAAALCTPNGRLGSAVLRRVRKMTSFQLRILAQVLPFLLLTPGLALAQAPPSRSQAAAAVTQPNNPAAARYTRQQIDQMVAPIALYPDKLLSQVLMAATYPPQIMEAAQWLQQPGNADLKDDALVAALQPVHGSW
jgi:hypothetical protein